MIQELYQTFDDSEILSKLNSTLTPKLLTYSRKQRENEIQWYVLQVMDGVGVLPSDSPRGIPRRVVMSRDSPRSERDGARDTRI